LKVLILSMHPEDRFAIRALKAGANGYVTKDAAPTVLAAAIRKVASGGSYASEAVKETLLAEMNSGPHHATPHELLSEREFQVFMLIAQGKTVGMIANELFLSIPTVSTYRSRILEKMHLKTNSDIIRYAFDQKLVE
jgi:two-component system, NarL family, invasion response regulator UvrY